MAQAVKIEAELRQERGKNAARRLRRRGRLPCMVYGGGGEAVAVAVDPKALASILHSEAGHNALVNMEIRGGETVRVILKEWQQEPVKGTVLHVDFLRVSRDTRLKVKVPIHAVGEPKGVKLQGGVFEFVLRELDAECLPDDIPETLTVDVTELEIGRHLRVSDLAVGPNVKVLTDPERVVAHVVAPRLEEEKPAEVAEVTAAEPELIRKPKAEEEPGEAETKES